MSQELTFLFGADLCRLPWKKSETLSEYSQVDEEIMLTKRIKRKKEKKQRKIK